MSGDAWIRIHELSLSRGGRPVLADISADLSGRAIGLVGPNGAGKSTLIGAMLGVLKPDRGTIHVLGEPLPQRAMTVRTRAGVMAEQAGVFPGGSGVDAVAFAGALSGLDRRQALRRAHRVLDALDVGEERYRPSSEYSTGMRQRCKLGMSLVHEPDFLILDEPTVGLDPPGRQQLLHLIRDLRDRGILILFSTHILQDAEFLCDSLLVLEAGRVTHTGTLGSLGGDPTTILRAGGAGLDEGFAAALQQAGYRIAEHGAAHVVFDPVDDPELRHFWAVAADRGAQVRSLGSDDPSLEDAVVRMLGGSSDV